MSKVVRFLISLVSFDISLFVVISVLLFIVQNWAQAKQAVIYFRLILIPTTIADFTIRLILFSVFLSDTSPTRTVTTSRSDSFSTVTKGE